MDLRLTPQATVIYRGNIQDTASLVGLALSRAPIALIAFRGELNNELKKYFEAVDTWLLQNDLPVISIHPNLSTDQLKSIIDRPYKQWGWNKSECESAIRLAGLPLPPAFLAA